MLKIAHFLKNRVSIEDGAGNSGTSYMFCFYLFRAFTPIFHF